MKTKIIKTEKEYNAVCERIYELMHQSDKLITVESSEGEELELLSLLVEKYEQEHFAISAPTPIEAIKFRMEQMNLKQKDVAPLFGGKTRVSEIFNGKRPLNLKLIVLLNRYLGIPLESLIAGNKEIQLEKKQEAVLLKNEAIRNFVG